MTAATTTQGKWSEHESLLLQQAYQMYHNGPDRRWANMSEWLISKRVFRCPTQIRHLWQKTQCPTLRTGRFDSDEDKRLVEAVTAQLREQKAVSWQVVADAVSCRSSKQCREHWINVLDPTLNRTAFTAEEDATLLSLTRGCKHIQWSTVAQHFDRRPAQWCRKRYLALTSSKRKSPTTLQVQGGNTATVTRRKRRRLSAESSNVDLGLGNLPVQPHDCSQPQKRQTASSYVYSPTCVEVIAVMIREAAPIAIATGLDRHTPRSRDTILIDAMLEGTASIVGGFLEDDDDLSSSSGCLSSEASISISDFDLDVFIAADLA